LSCNGNCDKSVVWLTDDPSYILNTQAGEDWISQNDPIILKIDSKKLDIKQRFIYATGKLAPHEYYYQGTIDKRFIMVK
jgi:hypothetical protein